MVTTDILDNLDKLSVLAFVLEHGELGCPKLGLFDADFILLHVCIYLILIPDQHSICEKLSKSRAVPDSRRSPYFLL